MKTTLQPSRFFRLVSFGAGLILLSATFGLAFGSTAKGAEVTAVPIAIDNSYTSVYRVLGQLAVEAVQNDDFPRAVVYAKILEVVWDRGENNLKTKSREKWDEVDEALDQFIRPIVRFADKKPAVAEVQANYARLAETLKFTNPK